MAVTRIAMATCRWWSTSLATTMPWKRDRGFANDEAEGESSERVSLSEGGCTIVGRGIARAGGSGGLPDSGERGWKLRR